MNWKYGIIYVMLFEIECDGKLDVLHLDHLYDSKSECVHILKSYLQIVQNDYFPTTIRPILFINFIKTKLPPPPPSVSA